MNFNEKYNEWVNAINSELVNYAKKLQTPEKVIYEAMEYSLMAGGKRLRPVLALSVCHMLGGEERKVLPFACAVEMIHTYSLIHDDLPAMDNDDYRRGKLTNHKVYGEAMAILAGDALLNRAFEVMLDFMQEKPECHMTGVNAMRAIASASGTSGMIGGQVVDLLCEEREADIKTLEYMHRCKTGALIKAPVKAAAYISEAGSDELRLLESYADKLGLAFQIKDDILDVEGSFSLMGKKTGSDDAKHKTTFVTMYGLDGAKSILDKTTGEALACLGIFGERAWFLNELTGRLAVRDK